MHRRARHQLDVLPALHPPDALLVQAGLNPVALDVRSHGEGELLVPTADNVFEPKNRRVEVTVR